MALDEVQLGNARLAYQEVCKSYQSIADFRAKLLGFLPLASGAGVYAVLGDGKDPPGYAWVAGIFGFLVTLGLFFYELRGVQRATALERAGRELELSMGLANGQFAEQPEAHLGGLVDARGAAWLIYPTVLAGWVYLAGVQRLGAGAALLGAVVAIGVAIWFARRRAALEPPGRAELAGAAG